MMSANLPTDNPSQIPPRTGALSRWIALLVIFSLVLIFAALNVISLTIRELNTPLRDQLDSLEQTLSVTQPPSEEERMLVSTLVSIREQIAGLQPIQTQLAAAHLDWPTAMQYIANYDSALLTLKSIAQAETQITLTGEAIDETVVRTYANALSLSGEFANVVVQSITVKVLPTPTPLETGLDAAPVTSTAYIVEFTLILER